MNLGDATKGGVLRPRRDLNPNAHWKRDQRSNPDEVIAGIEGHTTVAAVFDNFENMKAFVDDVRNANLGISVNISAPIEEAERCCRETGITRHSGRVLVGLLRASGQVAGRYRARAYDHVRARHDFGAFCEKNDRLGQGKPA